MPNATLDFCYEVWKWIKGPCLKCFKRVLVTLGKNAGERLKGKIYLVSETFISGI